MLESFVSLTFDDGREEQYSKFYPILNEYNLKATFYVVTERIGWKGVMGWNELKTLYKDGNEIGSHTHTHPHLTTLSNNELDFEFKKSRNMLRLFNCSTLAYPYGEYNERVVEHARKYFIAARGRHRPNKGSRYLGLNLDVNQEMYKLNVFPFEARTSVPLEGFEALQSCSLFQLPFTKFKQTLKELLEYNMKQNAWIIFMIHGTYHGKNISWILKKPKNAIEHSALRFARGSSIADFVKERSLKKDKILKFKWLCEYLVQNAQSKVLTVSQVIKDARADKH